MYQKVEEGFKIEFVKVICIIEDCVDYRIVEDVNRGNVNEAVMFISEHYTEHPNARWELIPYKT